MLCISYWVVSNFIVRHLFLLDSVHHDEDEVTVIIIIFIVFGWFQLFSCSYLKP